MIDIELIEQRAAGYRQKLAHLKQLKTEAVAKPKTEWFMPQITFINKEIEIFEVAEAELQWILAMAGKNTDVADQTPAQEAVNA